MNDIVNQLSESFGLADSSMLKVRTKILIALKSCFGEVDSGVGAEQCDFWIKDEGVEYKLVMSPNRSLRKVS